MELSDRDPHQNSSSPGLSSTVAQDTRKPEEGKLGSEINDNFTDAPRLPPLDSSPTPPTPAGAIVTQPRSNQPYVQQTTASSLRWLEEHISMADQLHVNQEREMIEIMCGIESANRFVIYDNSQRQIAFAQEESNPFERQCCGWVRTLQLNIVDNQGNIVLLLNRVEVQTMEVRAPPDILLGVVEMESYFSSKFKVRDSENVPVLCIEGPAYTGNLGGNVEFQVFSSDRSREVAKINKLWGGLLTEMISDSDSFQIIFTVGMSYKLKANILGAMFLIDMVFYENNN